MVRLLIMAHAPLASALRSVAEHVYPEGMDRLVALDVLPGWDVAQAEAGARQMLGVGEQGQTLILTDVFGATPCNAAQRLVDGAGIRLVTGVNVPMLWRVLCYSAETLDGLVERATQGGVHGVMQVASQPPQNQSLTTKNHDSTDAHHQQ